ncbi:SRPBCC domain-containing protein [Mucilaginibacter sp. S1162]|uniref:SRPBCC domain-containing protein n=1 Tax=Mucilaginibacter humi TaxID=2732510 RepID=A0ABX1W374_9SPHI|nr:SRPBCC domain-containing protein [Mucilaginibacter humi]NNU33425.1 SRPBCC domain-containing protein [Mucilaginibacter humi]
MNKEQNFNTTIIVDKSPAEVFDAINNVKGWWTENLEGSTHNLNDEFEVRFGDVHYSKQKLTEVIPGEKVVWLITDSKLTFVKDQTEWRGTKIVFDIVKRDGKTQVTFTQYGLTPAFECYGGCSNARTDYIQNSLYNLITTGKGNPSPKVS